MNRHDSTAVTAPARTAMIFLTMCAALLSMQATAQQEVLDRVIAIVDEGVILQSELEDRMEQIRARSEQAGQQVPSGEQLEEQVLESLIVENLQLQMAERAGVRFGDDTINSVLSELAASNNMGLDEFVASLERAGRYASTREQVRRELAMNEVQRGMVNRRINITDQEIENYLNSEMGREAMEADYRVNQILVPINAQDSEAVVERKSEFARELYQRIESGEGYSAVLDQASSNEQGFMVQGNELGWRQQDELPSLFTDIVPNMETGAAHEPVRSSNGFHVLYLAEVRGDSNRLVDQVNLRHILISPSEIRTEQQARRLAADLYQQIRDGEDFSALARQYSDDNMSVVAGGEMGWTSLGSLPPPFRDRVSQLETGELSEPFQTESGWHIAEVMDRRERDMSEQYRRQMAENALRERKFQVELESWLAELRDDAYVEILL